jgi:hypothetical protein
MIPFRVYSRPFGACVSAAAVLLLAACSRPAPPATKEITSQTSGDVVVTLLGETGELARGQNRFILAFRSASTHQPLEMKDVSIASSMAMPGMAPMVGSVEAKPAGAAGQYAVQADFAMSGVWQFEVRWDGPSGSGGASFRASVR